MRYNFPVYYLNCNDVPRAKEEFNKLASGVFSAVTTYIMQWYHVRVEDAEEITQRSLMDLWDERRRLRRFESAFPFLITIVKRKAWKQYREQIRREIVLQELNIVRTAEQTTDASEAWRLSEWKHTVLSFLAATLRSMLKSVKAKNGLQWAVAYNHLASLEGRSPMESDAELAFTHGVSLDAVRSSRSRLIKKLRHKAKLIWGKEIRFKTRKVRK